MKKYLLVSLSIFVGMFSVAFAANSISNRIDGDLYFHDDVYISSGVEYPSDIDPDGGTSSVNFDGEGSLTIGRRLGNGFPRVVLYGGTSFSVKQDFSQGSEKDWWEGKIKSPNKLLDIPSAHVVWENESNHQEGETNIAASFGFESISDTYSFNPASYLVLPIDVPNNTKVWYAFHSIDPENPGDPLEEQVTVNENDFCIVEDNLCVVEAEEMNQIILVEESFEKCPRNNVPNGSVGDIPYCVIKCDIGYELNENAIACDAIDLKSSEIIEEEIMKVSENIEMPTETVLQKRGGEKYRGANLKLNLIDTTGLSGKDLTNALRKNAEINRRLGRNGQKVGNTGNTDISDLTKIINDIRGTLWSWETQGAGTKTVAMEEARGEEIELFEEQNMMEESESDTYSTMHSSGYQLPSTGSSTIFIILSILGIGLMMLAFKR